MGPVIYELAYKKHFNVVVRFDQLVTHLKVDVLVNLTQHYLIKYTLLV